MNVILYVDDPYKTTKIVKLLDRENVWYIVPQTDRQTDWLTDWLTDNIRKAYIRSYIHVCRSSLLSGRNVRWPHRMLTPGESCWVCRRTDRQTDGRTPDRYITLSARRSQCNNTPREKKSDGLFTLFRYYELSFVIFTSRNCMEARHMLSRRVYV